MVKYDFEKEKEGAFEINWHEDIEYSSELDCEILKSTGKPLNGKYYVTDRKIIYYYKNGTRHRDDNLPSEIWKYGHLFYFANDISHRIDGPAIIYEDGKHRWNINGYSIDNETMDNWLKENNISLDWNTWSELDKFYFALHWSDYNG